MAVRDVMLERLGAREPQASAVDEVRLPIWLKVGRDTARTGMMRRLAASRLFAIGDRAGVLRTAQKRSGRTFRLDVRQKVIVKALVSRHVGKGLARGAGLARHVRYLGRSGAGADGATAEFFDRAEDGVDAAAATAEWGEDRHHFRFIVSPEHGDRIADMRGYTREVMKRVAEDLGQPALRWIATCHFDTDQPHAHVLIRGRRGDGKDLVIPRDYVGYGFRGRAQEVAAERLGDLSRAEAERRIWRETQADRFTGFDRRLLQSADAALRVEDGVGGTDAWTALSRGRLRHLEALGLAVREGRRYRLDPELELKLRGLQLRRDIIRTLQRRRLEGARSIQELGPQERFRGKVVRRGAHDELGAVSWVMVRNGEGEERYARLAFGQSPPAQGRAVELIAGPRGAQLTLLGRGADLDRS